MIYYQNNQLKLKNFGNMFIKELVVTTIPSNIFTK